ncbi:hypothetical protein DFH29DRAFT_999536 [Suillus ampliporus]|nr:hypothetical protein DFH29DRAFT_999536 [Suillus ampliporus]
MEPTQPPITHGRGKNQGSQGRSTASTGTSVQDQACSSKFTIQWQADPRCTEKVMEHLRTHPTDCCVLFYSDNKSYADGNRPLGKDKVSICQIITKHVFEHDPEYANYYPDEPERFCDSTNSHISGLRKKYCEFYNKLHSTGAGITPLDETTAPNLHVQIMEEFSWYDDLATILGGNPAVSLKTISSGSAAENVQSPSSPQYWGWVPCTQPPPPSVQPTPSMATYSECYGQLPSGANYSGYVHSHPGPSAQPHYAPSAQPSATTPHQTYAPLPYSHPGQDQMDYDDNDNDDLYMPGLHLMASHSENVMDLNSPP